MGLYLASNNTCQPCYLIACIECIGFQYCLKCSDGYMISASSAACLPCIAHCQYCAIQNSCFVCIQGYYLASPYSCKACATNCVNCNNNANNCTLCNVNYYLNGSSCVPCFNAVNFCVACVSNASGSQGQFGVQCLQCMA